MEQAIRRSNERHSNQEDPSDNTTASRNNGATFAMGSVAAD